MTGTATLVLHLVSLPASDWPGRSGLAVGGRLHVKALKRHEQAPGHTFFPFPALGRYCPALVRGDLELAVKTLPAP